MPESKQRTYINLKLAVLGLPVVASAINPEFQEMTSALLLRHQETARLLSDYMNPPDQRIQNFLDDYLRETFVSVRLPRRAFVLDRYGLARTMSLPPDKDEFVSEYAHSYRVRQGVLHNPRSDRRTTSGIFHVAEGGLPVPDDKLAVPKAVVAEILRRALTPPRELLRLPFTSTQEEQAECFVSLLLRPTVCPAFRGSPKKKQWKSVFSRPGAW